MSVFKGRTSSGFDFEVESDNLDDMELIEALAAYSAENPLPIVTICDIVLGKDQKARLFEHLKKIDGKVRMTKANAEIEEIFKEIGESGKNS